MANKYAVVSGLWSAIATWSDSDGGAGGAAVPADDDAVFISAAVNVQMDADLSAYTGLRTVTIRGGATPGMLYQKDGKSGILKIRTAYNLVGTTDTNRGRLLANSDGVWANTGALAFADKFIINLQGTSKVDATDLDINLRCAKPTRKIVRTYGTKYDIDDTDVSVANDTVDLGTAPPTAGTPIKITTAAGTLPAPLSENEIYYVRAISGNTCKLALLNADAQIVNLTSTGSGNFTLYTGYAAGSATVNVLDDVTADTPWSTTAGHNACVLYNVGPQSFDQQRLTLTTINAGSIVLSAVTDSAQLAGASIVLVSRNVQILSNSTSSSQPIVDYTTSTFAGGYLGCEIRNTAGTGTTFYGCGINGGTSHTNSGTIAGCNYGFYGGTSHTNSGTIAGCEYGFNRGTSHTNSGTITGCYYGFSGGTSYTNSGTITGCYYGISGGTSYTNSGTITGCNYGFYGGTSYTNSGTITGCNYGFYGGISHTNSGTIAGCTYGFYGGASYTNSGTIAGCNYTYRAPIVNNLIIGGDAASVSFYDRNTIGSVYDIKIEDVLGVLNTHKHIQSFADIIKTACDGTGDAPSVDPDGGNAECIECSNLQTNIAYMPARLFDYHSMRVWATGGVSKTYTFKCQTTMSTLGTAGRLVLTGSYLSNAVTVVRTEVTDDSGIAERSNDADWTQTVALTINPLQTGWINFRLELNYYEASDELYVWLFPVVT